MKAILCRVHVLLAGALAISFAGFAARPVPPAVTEETGEPAEGASEELPAGTGEENPDEETNEETNEAE